MKKVIIMSSLLVVVSLGCSTIKGIGEDLRNLGNGIANMADKVRDGMSKDKTQ